MDKFAKKLYYKLFDIFQFLSFLGKRKESEDIKHTLTIIKLHNGYDWKVINSIELLNLGVPSTVLEYIHEFQYTGGINKATQLGSCIDEWIKDLILPGYFDNEILAHIIRDKNIRNSSDLATYVNSQEFIKEYGEEISTQYCYLIKASDWSNFPSIYIKRNDMEVVIFDSFRESKIRGNFHNHTTFSDGTLSLEELISLAILNHREYIGISDHSKKVDGVDEHSLETQHQIIDKIRSTQNINIFKSIECEILDDGNLDLSPYCLEKLDYVIAAVHSNAQQPRKLMESRLIKAIENPLTKILAHPSARIYKKKPPVNVDMYKILDACIQNNVVIEINGDPSRLDLDPKYIGYALDKGAYFSLDSDTHSLNGFFNINNSILIARELNIPPERCINTFTSSELDEFFDSLK